MSVKSFSRVEVKSEEKGEVTAVFATFGVRDKDGDVTAAGAFEDGADVVISAYQHQSWSGALPVGAGKIRTTKTEAILDGQFFLDTTPGLDTFRTVAKLGALGLGEWSYGYDPVKYSFGEHEDERVRFLEQLKVHEVSPVLIGAGVNTRTLAAKAAGQRFADELAEVLASVESATKRAADVVALRREKGKGLAEESGGLIERLDVALKSLREVLTTPNEQPDPSEQLAELADIEREFLRFSARLAG